MRRTAYTVLMLSLLASGLVSAVGSQPVEGDAGSAPVTGTLLETVQSITLFRSLLETDLSAIPNDVPEIEGFYLEHSPYFAVTVVHINYTSNLTDLEKIGWQFVVQDELEPKWYIKYVEPNYIYSIPENPPPPWPGFAIGELIVGFISQLPDPIIVPDHFPAIQLAINNASEGATIFVKNGTYFEHVIVNKPLSLVGESRTGTIIDGSGTGTVVTILAHNSRVTGFTLQNGLSEVMMVENVSRVEVCQNNIVGSGVALYGIHIWFSVEVALVDNLIINSHPLAFGTGIYGSNSSLISRNEISSGCSVMLVGSNSSTISNNLLFSKGSYGTRLCWSYSNLICGNRILNASWYGLALDYASAYNTIFHNNFLNNTVQVGSPHYFTLNYWDNGCEGNFWLEYAGLDANGDGIGDTPHVINENNTDPYPLMTPYWNPGDINHDTKVDILDVVLCASAYGCTPSDPNWNPHGDIVEPSGVIDIFDIVIIASSYGEEYAS